jgi:hypothetical protein
VAGWWPSDTCCFGLVAQQAASITSWKFGPLKSQFKHERSFFMFYAQYLFSKHAEMHSNTLLLPLLLKENACF